MKHMTRQELREARARTRARGANLVKGLLNAPMTPARRVKLREAAARGAAARRVIGDATFAGLLELAAQGASLREAMEAMGLSENGVRKNLRDRLGSGSWPPKGV